MKNVSSSLAASLAVAAFLLGGGGAIAATSSLGWLANVQKRPAAGQLQACRALAEVRGLHASVVGAMGGDSAALARLPLRSAGLKSAMADMTSEGSPQDSDELQLLREKIAQRTESMLAHRDLVVQAHAAVQQIDRQSADLLETLEVAGALHQQQTPRPTAAETMAIGQLLMLSQRLGKNAMSFFQPEGVSPESVFLLGKDLNSFKDLTSGLLNGSKESHLPGVKLEEARKQLQSVVQQGEALRQLGAPILGNLQALVHFHDFADAVRVDSQALEGRLEGLCAGPGEKRS
jgi:twitching motility protein PilJ